MIDRSRRRLLARLLATTGTFAFARPMTGGPVRGTRRTEPGVPELPRRIRQTNLAPQLRRDTPGPGPIGMGPASTRPPEETRSLMAALQEGWTRGREEQDPDE